MATFLYKGVKLYIHINKNSLWGKFSTKRRSYIITSDYLDELVKAFKGIAFDEYDLQSLNVKIYAKEKRKRK